MRADCLVALGYVQLPPMARDVLTFLVSMCMDEHGAFWVGSEAIAVDSRHCRRTVLYALAWLREMRVLDRVKQGGGKHRPSLYIVQLDPILRRYRRSAADWHRMLAAVQAEYADWLARIFREHIRAGRDCARWAPARVRPLALGPPP